MSTNEMLNVLLSALRKEIQAAADFPIPEDTAGKWRLLRALMNIRPPIAITPDLLEVQDRLLSAQRGAKGVTDLAALPSIQMEFPGTHIAFAEHLVLWRGDITTLREARSSGIGCWIRHPRDHPLAV